MHGSANKNVGDAFMLVWKIPSSVLSIVNNNEFVVTNKNILSHFADVALYSLLRIMI